MISRDPRWRAGRDRSRRAAGFTLLELIVVITLLGIVLSMATLALTRGGREDVIMADTERLAALIRLLAQEAVFSGRPLGIDLSLTGYTPVAFNGQDWLPLADDVIHARHLSSGASLRSSTGGAFAANDGPDLILLPDGAATLPALEIVDSYSDARARIAPIAGPALVEIGITRQ